MAEHQIGTAPAGAEIRGAAEAQADIKTLHSGTVLAAIIIITWQFI